LQAFFQFIEGFSPVTDHVFHLRAEFGNGTTKFRNDKYRVITETFTAGGIKSYFSP